MSQTIQVGSVSANQDSPGWNLNQATGTFAIDVDFEPVFQQAPTVTVAMNNVGNDMENGQFYIQLTVVNVTITGFTINVTTINGTQLFGIGVSWIAVGAAPL